ncbi:MAG: isoprenyl transferase [Planctomycetes bacterium]|nr:isoprenyl transferase [Planctomycetota bacterium]
MSDVPPERLPRHVAMIMDGNGRWARARGLPRIEGHRRGVQTVRMVIETCAQTGIQHLTLYCFSSENWKRPKDELETLMHLLEQYLIEERGEMMRQNLRLSIIGRREGLSEGILREIDKTTELCQNNTGMHLCLAVNYGARCELVDAVRAICTKVATGELTPQDVDERLISDHLYTRGMPDPDLVIRTAGEMRVSNFLLWQISYAEIWVTQRCWPEFRREDLLEAFRDYASRVRRFGGLEQDPSAL